MPFVMIVYQFRPPLTFTRSKTLRVTRPLIELSNRISTVALINPRSHDPRGPFSTLLALKI